MAWIMVGVAVVGVGIQAFSAVSSNKLQNKGLNAQMTAEELRAAYERDLSTTQNFEQWAASQTAQYQSFNQSTAKDNTFIYAAAAVVVLVGGISLIYLLKED